MAWVDRDALIDAATLNLRPVICRDIGLALKGAIELVQSAVLIASAG